MKAPSFLLVASLLFALALPVRAATPTETPPRPVKKAAPVYTDAMHANPVYGDVTIEVDLDAKGKVTNARVAKSLSPDADQAALASVQKWIFEPAAKDGLPVATHTRINIRFGPPPTGVASRVDTPARPLKQVPPVSTDAMRRSYLKGVVVVEGIVDETGRVTEASVARSLSPDADRAALECVQKWLFKPATKGGQPVRMRVSLPIQFNFN